MYGRVVSWIQGFGRFLYFFATLHFWTSYFLMILVAVLVAWFIYIKVRYPFWNIHTIYHTYDWMRWVYVQGLAKGPRVLRTMPPYKTKYVVRQRVETHEFAEILDKPEEAGFLEMLQCHTFFAEHWLNQVDRSAIRATLTGAPHPSYISFIQEERYDASFTLVREIKGVMSSRALSLYWLGKDKMPVYYWDHICIHRSKGAEVGIPRKNIAYKLMDTHEYNRRILRPEIGATLFKKEGALCGGIVPLFQYRKSAFALTKKIGKPAFPLGVVVVAVQTDELSDILYMVSRARMLCVFPDIAVLDGLLKVGILRAFALKNAGSILAVYFFRDTQIVVDSGDSAKILESSCSVNIGGMEEGAFFAGFLESLRQILDIEAGAFSSISIVGVADNEIVLQKWAWKYSAFLELAGAYYLENAIVPKMPLSGRQCFVLT